MTFLIIATVSASVVYFVSAFVAHIVKSVGDRRHPKTTPAPITKPEPTVIVTEPDYEDLSYEDMCDVLWDGVKDEEPEIQDATVTDYVTKFRPALVVQTANIYQNCNIRQLKKLASGRVKNYSKLTKSQLIAALA